MIDLAIYGVLAIAIAAGMYRGFMFSLVRILAFFLAWVLALFMYPMVSQAVSTQTNWINTLHYYSEDTYQLDDLELWRTDINSIPPGDMTALLANSHLPRPFDRLLAENVEARALEAYEKTSLEDYFNYTVVFGIVNILSFVAVFAFAHVLLMLAIEALDHVFHFPVIRIWDPLGGLGCGLLYGVLITALLLSLLPVGLVMLPADLLTTYLDESKLLPLFERYEWVTSAVRGLI